MDRSEVTRIVQEVRTLVEEQYVYPDIGAEVARILTAGLAEGRYPAGEHELADAVTADLQAVNGDKHLRLLYHDQPAGHPEPGDGEQYDFMRSWAQQTCGGIAGVQRLAGNVGCLNLQPVLFPAVIGGEFMTAAMSLIAATQALIVDLRQCLGGEPAMAAFIVSYLWDHDPVQITGLLERQGSHVTQFWTLPYVPGRRFGKTKPVYALTSAATFSGGEQLAYDLQQLSRAVIVGETTRGGGHAREGFRVHPHLEATISVAAAISPRSGSSWEGTGVSPDIDTPAAEACDVAYQLALEQIVAADGPQVAEARASLARRPGYGAAGGQS